MEVPMAMGRPKAVLVLSAEQRAQLESMASSRSLPAGLVTRVRIVLLSAAGKMNQQIARQLGLTNATVGKWRRRFLEQGVAGLAYEFGPGTPRPIRMTAWRSWCARRWRPSRETARAGVCDRSQARPDLR